MRSFRFSHRGVLLAFALAGCWTFWSLASAVAWSLKVPKNIPFIIHYSLIDDAVGVIVCGLLFAAYSRLRARLGLGAFIAVLVPVCVVGAIAWHATSALALWGVGWQPRHNLNAFSLLVGGGVNDGLTLALFALLFLAVDHWHQLRDEKEKAREAAAAANAAQLQMLRYQLNPHFLFNALNSIRAMIVREPERARQIVTELSEFLRYSLSGRGAESTIGGEIEAIDNYLAIQRIRFEDKLAVAVTVEPGLRDLPIPSFLVHPLIENAVKYGMQTSDAPLRIGIAIFSRDRDVVIQVRNSGRLVTLDPARNRDDGLDGTGTGLQNVRRRLQLAFPDRHTFKLVAEGGGVLAEIVLGGVHADPGQKTSEPSLLPV